jgi:hypothetical protein
LTYLLDTNVLLLLVIGLTDRQLIGQHKRTRQFDAGHVDQLITWIGEAIQIATTSNVLTEVSNLGAQIGEPRRSHIRGVLAELIRACTEIHLPGRLVIEDPHFLRLGLTDALILELGTNDHHVLSVDAPLCHGCHAVGLPYTNPTPSFFE